MMISEKQLQEFMALYKKRFGKEIGRAKALESAQKLLNLVRIIMKDHIRRKTSK